MKKIINEVKLPKREDPFPLITWIYEWTSPYTGELNWKPSTALLVLLNGYYFEN